LLERPLHSGSPLQEGGGRSGFAGGRRRRGETLLLPGWKTVLIETTTKEGGGEFQVPPFHRTKKDKEIPSFPLPIRKKGAVSTLRLSCRSMRRKKKGASHRLSGSTKKKGREGPTFSFPGNYFFSISITGGKKGMAS